jgi:hypothetical protein
MVEEIKDANFLNIIEKLKQIFPNIKQTSRWQELKNDQKTAIVALMNLPNDFFAPEKLTLQNVRNKIVKTPALYKSYKSLSTQEGSKNTISGMLLNAVSSMFDLYFQGELNVKVRNELKNFISKELELNKEIESGKIAYLKIEWLGTQKQLGELFVELNRKGWITDIPTDLIKNYFTKSNTIEQVLKPSLDLKTKENAYEGIYTTNYKPRFDSIRKNTDK